MGPGPFPQCCSELSLDVARGIHWHPSPNFGPRREGARPGLILLHYTAMQSARAALERLCDPVAEVSSHYLIGRDGTVWQLVQEDMRAWHAGAGEWCGQSDVNSRSIGIELDNEGCHPFSQPLMAALERLMPGIMARWAIPPQGVIGHSDMAPGRKFDPGPRFDWTRLARQGMAEKNGYDDGPQDPTFSTFSALARDAGFTAPVDNETLLAAVRLRYRPYATGPLESADFTPIGHTSLWT